MNEAELAREVVALLDARPQLAWHMCGRSLRCRGQAGWPDLCIIGRRVIFRELKGDDTRLRRHQWLYGNVIMDAGGSWGCWRPPDLVSGRIEGELDALV